jgi:low affinity Fe/Cu permease
MDFSIKCNESNFCTGIPQTQEQLTDPIEAEHLTTTTGVPVTDEEELLDRSHEDLHLPETTVPPMVDSGEAGHLPVIIGVTVAVLLTVVVISTIIHKKKLCSKMLLQLNHR